VLVLSAGGVEGGCVRVARGERLREEGLREVLEVVREGEALAGFAGSDDAGFAVVSAG